MTVASMSWRVPAHPQEAASTPVRSTSTAQLTRIPPKQSLETRRSWRSSSQTWIKPWKRCELCCAVWRGAAPALSLPDAASAPLAGVGMALGTGTGGGDGSGCGTMVTRPCQRQEGTALGRTWPCPARGLVAPRALGGSWAAAEAPRGILGKISLQDISVTSVSPPGWEAWFLGGICHC